jgi:hypothetical protein
MTRNLGTLDRRIRGLVVAPLLVVLALLVGAGSVAGIVLLVIAAVMVATSAVGFCPLYALFHLSTRGGPRALSH